MYDDYDNDYLDGLDDELDSYNDEIEEYNDNLESLDSNVSLLENSYEFKIKEIDAYWDRENQYIIGSGIYTKDEVQQIIAHHEEIRRSQKEDAQREYQTDMSSLSDEREQIMFDKEMAEFNRDYVKGEIEYERMARDNTNYNDILRAKIKERNAYDVFIASLDMDN